MDVAPTARRRRESRDGRPGPAGGWRRVAAALLVVTEADQGGLERGARGNGRDLRDPGSDLEDEREHDPTTLPHGFLELAIVVGFPGQPIECLPQGSAP